MILEMRIRLTSLRIAYSTARITAPLTPPCQPHTTTTTSTTNSPVVVSGKLQRGIIPLRNL